MEQAEFDSANIWSYCQQVLNRLDETEEAADSADVPARDRLRWLASMVLGHKKDDPRTYSAHVLATVEPAWSQVVSYLSSYPSMAGYLDNAVNQAEAALVPLGSWPAQAQRGGAAALASRTFEAYTQSAEELRERLVGRIEELEQELSAAEAARRTQVDETQAAVDELSSSLAREQQRVEQVESQMATALKENTSAFLKAQSDREDEFSEWLQSQSAELLKRAKPGLDRTDEIKDEATDILQALVKLRDETEGMAGEAAGAVLARDYGQAAQEDRTAGKTAYIIGFSIIACVAIYLAISLFSVGQAQNELSWEYLAVRLVLSATGGAAATVAFTRGSKFYSSAEENKNRELELRAIGPFLSGVSVQRAEEARLDFLRRTFGVRRESPAAEEPKPDAPDMKES